VTAAAFNISDARYQSQVTPMLAELRAGRDTVARTWAFGVAALAADRGIVVDADLVLEQGRQSIETIDRLRKIVDEAPEFQLPQKGRKVNGTHVADEADHYKIAAAFAEKIGGEVPPVYSLGVLWTYRNGLWVSLPVEAAAAGIGRSFGGLKYCRRGSDFSQIAKLACAQVADDHFFELAPAGIATPAGFWRVADDGGIVCEKLTPEHRQRMQLEVDPDFETETPLFDALLDQALGGIAPDGDDGDQIELLQMAAGGALARSLWRYRTAILLLGKTTTGKTTLMKIIKSVFPADQVAATSPQRWGNEYYTAALAGKAINVVGELDPHDPIPGGAFKNVVGNDPIDGRHPTHRPFTFVCQAAHFFNANKLPPTVDRSDAFFRRWRILSFEREVPEERIDPEYAEKVIVGEIGGVVAWMLNGAKKLATAKALPETPQHRAALTRWRVGNNSALQFLLDTAACRLDPSYQVSGQELFAAYTRWAADAGVRAFGRNGFYEAIDEGAGRLGVRCKSTRGEAVNVVGVTLAGWAT